MHYKLILASLSVWAACFLLLAISTEHRDLRNPLGKVVYHQPKLEEVELEDPDEAQKSLEAIKAKSNVIHNCAVTGYAPELVEAYKHMNSDGKGNYLTASGQWVRRGYVVAVDPTVIPIGATVVIGDDVYLALDTGVVGNVVDILMSPEEALTYGVNYQDVYWCMEVE